MNYKVYGTFENTYQRLAHLLRSAPAVRQNRWQGVDVRGVPAARCYEVMNVVFSVDLGDDESLDTWREHIKPNLPWADDHFAERVSGMPLNPGKEWANWPWSRSASKFRDESELFNHTYSERLWPKYARRTPGGIINGDGVRKVPVGDEVPISGIALEYGDLLDLVGLLVRDPYTRQAWIPLFFPEDTGWADGGRKPCTLGYQFTMRDDRLSIWYPLRSCDLYHHWRDDCYLAVRLLLWVLDRCRDLDDSWNVVKLGMYSMHITSLHVFENDRRLI